MKILLTEIALFSVFFGVFTSEIEAGPGHEGHEEKSPKSSDAKKLRLLQSG